MKWSYHLENVGCKYTFIFCHQENCGKIKKGIHNNKRASPAGDGNIQEELGYNSKALLLPCKQWGFYYLE
ncbi:hypothetical protein P378_00185 [Desulforamulus profundi]|uniref:Uncharacterized protein n=1 Tax=Desulforamulus profundi TaxID=1383067 RepID=A0A2C6MK40_9FIRM|nr:hypothetical protein P378_00185 [Desulforamulus profundi]